MTETKRSNAWIWWTVGSLLAAGLLGGYLVYRDALSPPAAANLHELSADKETPPGKPTVEVVVPQAGGTEKLSVQPCTVQAIKHAQLVAEVSGQLLILNVDIGSRVKKGQTLAVIDVPELEKTVLRNKAAWDQAKANIDQMKAQVKVAEADVEAARASEIQAKAAAKSAEAWVRFRLLQKNRIRDLLAQTAIEERLYDEAKERYEAALETERAAQAAIETTKAMRLAKAAQVEKANADRVAAEAQAEVAKSEWEKSKVLVNFATITSPYTGIITQRSVFPGDFVRSASGTNLQVPLLTVEKINRMRVIAQIPDQDVPETKEGLKVYVTLDALPNEKLEGTISRTADAEDPLTRLMRVEIDLDNPMGKIRSGMFGKVKIVLTKSTDPLTIPVACLVAPPSDNRGKVFVVREGRAVLVAVELGTSNGTRIGVRKGLTLTDHVVLNPGSNLRDGVPVEVEVLKPSLEH